LLLADRVDEWVVSNLHQYAEKALQSVAKGSLDLGLLEDENEKSQLQNDADAFKPLTDKIAETLSEQVKEVRVTHRLTDSAACLVADEHAMSGNLEPPAETSRPGRAQ
jgi:molecular chaperone HtpG